MRCVPAKAAQFPKKAQVHHRNTHKDGTDTSLLFSFFLLIYLILAMWGLFCYEGFFSSCIEPGPLSGCPVQASPCNHFSCCRAQALWYMDSVVVSPGLQNAGSIVAHGLSCSVACVISPHQGSNLCLQHWQVDFYPLNYQGHSIISFQNLHEEFWGQSGATTEQG